MTTTAQSYMLGATSTSGSFKLLSVLAIPDPESDFQNTSDRVRLGSGITRGMGLPVAEWHYGYLTHAQWTALVAFCTSESANVFIATMKNDGTFVEYSAVMVMPEKYVVRATRYVDVTITFENLVEV
jgi:hypothetical protein